MILLLYSSTSIHLKNNLMRTKNVFTIFEWVSEVRHVHDQFFIAMFRFRANSWGHGTILVHSDLCYVKRKRLVLNP